MATRTPWGNSDHKEKVAPGIIFYGTPSHGGYHLSPKRNARVAEPLRRADGWYEEDCDYARVVITFPEFFSAERVTEAKRSVKSWSPDEYTAATGEKVNVEDEECSWGRPGVEPVTNPKTVQSVCRSCCNMGDVAVHEPGTPLVGLRPDWCTCAPNRGGPYEAPRGYVAKFTVGGASAREELP